MGTSIDSGQELQHCPLCGFEFRAQEGCSSCPMSEGCEMVKCPNCRYEYVVRSRVVDGIKALFARVFAKEKQA